MKPELQKRVQRYGWDKASKYYENCWQIQLKPAHDLLMDVANIQPKEHILDVAAGTGLISFPMAEKVGKTGIVLATDISDEMVEIGNKLVKSKNIHFEQMDAENLQCDDESFDVVTCALGLMYFPYPDVSLTEMYRTLKPNGRATVAVWGSRKNCGWSEIFPIIDKRVKTDVCPMFFNLGEKDILKYYFKNAGFNDISLHRIESKLVYSSVEEACDASFLGGPVAMAYSRFDENSKIEARKEYIAFIEKYKTKNGYKIPAEFVIVSGVKKT